MYDGSPAFFCLLLTTRPGTRLPKSRAGGHQADALIKKKAIHAFGQEQLLLATLRDHYVSRYYGRKLRLLVDGRMEQTRTCYWSIW